MDFKNYKIKRLQLVRRSASGRNNLGRLTSFRKGGGLKTNQFNVDFKRILYYVPAKICSVEYDCGRSSFVSLVLYKNGFLSYILTPKRLKIGDIIMASRGRFLYTIGDSLPLKYIQIGTLVHNIELNMFDGAKLVRSAGVFAKVVRQDYSYTHIKLRSGEIRMINNKFKATVGALSNDKHKLKKYSKAGILRNLGVRPTVRGIAMNPVDHPNGGRTKGGTPFMDRWGNLSKGGRLKRVKTNRLIVKFRFK